MGEVAAKPRVSAAGGMSENLAVLGRYSERMFSGDADAVMDVFHPDFRSHVTSRVNPDIDGTDIRGEEQRYWREARAAFPDMDFRVEVLIESDDLVVSHWVLTGTHTGADFYGVPASGEPVTIQGTAILRFQDGMIVEHWGGPHCQGGVGLVH